MEIKLRDVSKSYGEENVLKDVSIEFKENMLTSIVGISGSGKSTLLNLIGGLDNLSSGNIFFNNLNISKLNDKQLNEYRNKCIGFVFQDYMLVKDLSVIENVLLPCYINGDSKDLAYEKANKVLKQVGLTDFINKLPNQLSGGQKQRVAIARAIVNNPKVLIADEPTGNLDSKNSKEIYELLNSLKKNRIVIIVTHDELITKYSDCVLQIEDGTINNNNYVESNESAEKSEEFSLNKVNSLKLISLIKLAWRSFKSRKIKILPMIITLTIVLIGINLVIAMDVGTKREIDNIGNNFFEQNYYIISSMESESKEFYLNDRNVPLKDSEFAFLDNLPNNNYTLKKYKDVSFNFEYNDDVILNTKVKSILLNTFFEEKIFYNNIIGIMPKNHNQIIISKEVADKLDLDNNYESLIGQSIKIKSRDVERLVEISGVNLSFSADGKNYNYISNELITEIAQEVIDENTFAEIVSDFNISYTSAGYVKDNIGKVHYSNINNLNSNLDDALLYGRMPTSSNEIVISVNNLKYNINQFTTSNVDIEDIKNRLIPDEEINTYLSSELYLISNEVYLTKVVGVYDDELLSENELNNQNYDINTSIYVTEELYTQFKILYASDLDIYFTENIEIENIRNTVESNNLKIEQPYWYLSEGAGNKINNIQVLFGAISFIFIIVSIVMINSFITSSVIERTEMIGILRSLGVKKNNIMFLFNLEGLYIGLISSILFLLFIPVTKLVSINILEINYELKFWYYILIVLFGIIITMISSLIPSYRASKMIPIKAIKR